MANFRLIVLVIAFEVLTTTLMMLGIYFGFSVFPNFEATLTSVDQAVQSSGFNATIPLYMPTLSDLKVPYTQLQLGAATWGVLSVLMCAVMIVMQSFVRGMYLGGLKAAIQQDISVPLLACGRKFFKSMLAWSLFHLLMGVITFFLAIVFFPIAIILIISLMFYSLTPYLMVLQHISFGEALAKAPRVFRRSFGKLLPLAILALLCTLFISLTKLLSPPFGYVIPLVAFAIIGTMLIRGLMGILITKLKENNEQIPQLPLHEVTSSRLSTFISVLLVPVLITVGVFASSGQLLAAFDWGSKNRFAGVSFFTNFSEVFHLSQQQYTVYEWQSGDYHIDIQLPDLSNGQNPEQLRGTANITWNVMEEVRTVDGYTTYIDVQPFTRESKLLYRLVRETAKDGTTYYSSMNGFASIMQGSEQAREPLSVQMMVSGDGSNIFVLQYPTRFSVQQVFRVSDNGEYLIPRSSEVNPTDFHTYWFNEKLNAEDIFEFFASKNKMNYFPSLDRAYIALAVAMQEADGQKVVEILDLMKLKDVEVNAPDWDELEWTNYLRKQYNGASLEQMLELMKNAGIQFGYESKEIAETSSETIDYYELKVPFANEPITIIYGRSKEDGSILSLSVLD
ncbi:MAG TPA: hypothetical protein IAA29_15385 [Candidatus Paenibacillus intestinavium]|nr:hypothetical protein [Candidatus Paenibacillus intestinavium]